MYIILSITFKVNMYLQTFSLEYSSVLPCFEYEILFVSFILFFISYSCFFHSWLIVCCKIVFIPYQQFHFGIFLGYFKKLHIFIRTFLQYDTIETYFIPWKCRNESRKNCNKYIAHEYQPALLFSVFWQGTCLTLLFIDF